MKLKLDWAKVNQVHQDSSLTSLLAKFTNVFSEELGSLVGTPIKNHLKEGERPRFFKSRNVQCGLRSKVEAQLDRVQKAGITSSVDFSEWAAPIVPVKLNGAVRICGDYKLSQSSSANR